jgi:hypothetical protein
VRQPSDLRPSGARELIDAVLDEFCAGRRSHPAQALVLLGFAWFLSTLEFANSPFVYTFASSPAGSGAACSCTSA